MKFKYLNTEDTLIVITFNTTQKQWIQAIYPPVPINGIYTTSINYIWDYNVFDTDLVFVLSRTNNCVHICFYVQNVSAVHLFIWTWEKMVGSLPDAWNRQIIQKPCDCCRVKHGSNMVKI